MRAAAAGSAARVHGERPARRGTLVAALGTAQTLAWASSYYLPAVLADPIAAGLGLPQTAVFAAFSASLLLSAVLGPAVGRAIDRRGGRGVLMLSNLVLAGGIVLLAAAHGVALLAVAWLVLGVGMALGLYDAAFAALARIYGGEARGAITGITLIAGFASTVGWPASALFADALGWRGACLVWALLHLALGLPLNWLLGPAPPATAGPRREERRGAPVGATRATALLAFVFAMTWFVTSAMAAHLPRLLMAAGASSTAAIAAAALVGPAQVAARLVEFAALRRVHPVFSTRLATLLHPIGAGILVLGGAPAIAGFALLHGAGNGMLTIAKGTLPLALFGPIGYGRRTGLIGAPARATQAAAPLVFGLLLDRMGTGVLVVSSALSLAALAALFALPRRLPGVGEAAKR